MQEQKRLIYEQVRPVDDESLSKIEVGPGRIIMIAVIGLIMLITIPYYTFVIGREINPDYEQNMASNATYILDKWPFYYKTPEDKFMVMKQHTWHYEFIEKTKVKIHRGHYGHMIDTETGVRVTVLQPGYYYIDLNRYYVSHLPIDEPWENTDREGTNETTKE